MFETPMTVIGTVISDPVYRTTRSGEEVVSFRMASNSRRRDPETNGWADDKTLYLTVSCWRRLVSGVKLSVAKRNPVIVHGNVHTSEYLTGDGERRTTLEMSARAVGLDLSRCIVEVRGYPSAGCAPVGDDAEVAAVEVSEDGAAVESLPELDAGAVADGSAVGELAPAY